jgi:SPP1 gp7 family putative phage head morphogenesis protein
MMAVIVNTNSSTNMEPEIKAIISDIVNKYLTMIDPDEIKDFLYNVVEKHYNQGLERGEIEFNMNFVPDYKTVSFVQKYAFDNVKGLTEEIKEALRKQMVEGLLNHESIPQLKLRIMETMDTNITRAELIVRTETNRAFNMGHYQAAQDSGLEIVKEWNAQPEKDIQNPCPKCEKLNGQRVSMNAKFPGDYFLPPAHPRCKCRVLYVQK